MKSPREIRRKIKLIENIQKITHAMHLVSASKMRRAQKSMLSSRPYSKKILDVILHLSSARISYRHPFLEPRDIKRAGFIVVSSDRGLCGALNLSLFRQLIIKINRLTGEGIECDLCLIGERAGQFFKNHGKAIVAKSTYIGNEKKEIKHLIGVVKVMLDYYFNNRIQVLFLCYNEFISAMQQFPKIRQLLPIVSTSIESAAHTWDYIYEPDAETLLDRLLNRYIESQVYQGVVENISCEQAARMLAMKNATENAQKLVDDLGLSYNQARQSLITNELAEIACGSGASALG